MFHLIDQKGDLLQYEDGHDVIVNRTNNPLERFNRKLNEQVPKHPTMQTFVECIKSIFNDYIDKMKVIKLGKRGKAPKHAEVASLLPTIPADFASFQQGAK